MNDLKQTFIDHNDVVFTMIAEVDGETVVRFTSLQSFDDLTGFSQLADEAFENYVLETEQAKLDLITSDETEDLIEVRQEERDKIEREQS